MSLQAIRDALYSQLVTCGPYAASEVSTCSFGVLETTATCAVVFMPGTDTAFEELSGTQNSGADFEHWSIGGSVYIRDSGDHQRLLNLVWQAHDDLWDTLRKDRSLGGYAANARLTGMGFDPRLGLEAGGAYWAEVRWKLRADDVSEMDQAELTLGGQVLTL